MKHQRSFLFFLGLLIWAGCSKEEGCTYVEACNYSEEAVVDDGSCEFSSCAGCTDSNALNYDPSATTDDGSCEFNPAATTANCVSSVDFDSYTYPVVAIGGQCWFAENLRSTVFRDGTVIPEETAANFPDLTTPAQTTYNSSPSTFNAQGRHYNGHAATNTENGGLCPSGWHVPTELDWMELESFLVSEGSGKRMGRALKSTSGWASSGNGEDTYGFNASGAGHIWPDGGTYSLNYYGHYHSSTLTDGGNIMVRGFAFDSDQMVRETYWAVTGCSVRCIEDMD